MLQVEEKKLLLKYLENKCSAAEMQQIAHYLVNTEYPDLLDEILEEEWKKINVPTENNELLAGDLLKKFYKKINHKG
ncbi:hypothetical protein ACFGVR_20230 [Mucilaginibacter sp. AW1-3]